VLFLFETAEAEPAFLHTAARLSRAPFVSSYLPALTDRGVLCPSWRLLPPHPAARVPLHTVQAVRPVRTDCGYVPEYDCTRPERFL